MPQNAPDLNRTGFFSRYILPKTIYARLFLIIVLPVVMVQVFSLYVFYYRHWTQATQSLSYSIISGIEIAIQTHKVDPEYAKVLANKLGLNFLYSPSPIANIKPYEDRTGKIFTQVFKNSPNMNAYPYAMNIRFIPPSIVRIQVGHASETYTFTLHEYRLYTTVTAKLVGLWTIFIGVIFVAIALLFARNQARPIKKLSQAAIAFSKGDKNALNTVAIRGSNEVREAIYSLQTMATRINRHQQQRANMLSGISHDLRTPLTRMKLQLALMQQSDDSKVLSENINDLENMIQSYLDFASQQKDFVWERIDINKTLQKICDKWQAVGNTISLTITEPPACIQGDSGHITRMIENIVSNGFTYAHTVHIKMYISYKTVHIDIIDDGNGIPDDKIDHMFRPFVRLDESRNSATGGVGLGLSIALDIATKHGGNITLQNRTDTSGLVATITLPLWQQ